MRICKRCINTLNDANETADSSYKEIGQIIRRIITKKLLTDLHAHSVPEWRKAKAKKALKSPGNFEEEYESSFPYWFKKLLSDNSITATNRMKKSIRAERLGILYRIKPRKVGYPKNWDNKARMIRQKDNTRCNKCGDMDATLDVHHIVYVRNFGTHRQNNLVTLCRECHENEHGVTFSDNTRYDQIEIPKSDNVKQGVRIENSTLTEAVSPPIKTADSHSNLKSSNVDNSSSFKNRSDKQIAIKPRPFKNKRRVVKETNPDKEDINAEIVSSDSQLAPSDTITKTNQPTHKKEKENTLIPISQNYTSFWDKYWLIFVAFAFFCCLLLWLND